MDTFNREYKRLNPQQKTAVDTIDGPVMVLAGPGTGKTRILTMRVANILRNTDTPPSSILCLTFTDSAARTMRQRLVDLIGEDATHIAVHTFHSFGLEVINRYPEMFAERAGYQPIDEVSQYELIEHILSHLPRRSPLAIRDNSGRLIWQDSIRAAISQLKKAGFDGTDLRAILDENEAFIRYAEPLLNDALAGAWRGKTINSNIKRLQDVRRKMRLEPDPGQPRVSYPTYKTVLLSKIDHALASAPSGVRQFRIDNMTGVDGNRRLRDGEQMDKLRDLATVFDQYQNGLANRRLHDYDDQILAVTKAMTNSPDLKADLQERYLYILVDEFQDTSDTQLRLLLLLGDNPISEGRPNVMVVGDDDQAIYRFQGAEISNLLTLRESFRQTMLQPLFRNYRSTPNIVEASSFVIGFCRDRLAESLPGIHKQLQAERKDQGKVTTVNLPDANSERHWVSREIQKLIQNGVPASEIAVIGRRHEDLISLLPHLDFPITYERRDDVLAQPHVHQLIAMARTIANISAHDRNALKNTLPEIMTYSFWKIKMTDIWQLSWQADSDYRGNWLDAMLNCATPEIKQVALFLLETARMEPTSSAEEIMDILIGNSSVILNTKHYSCPFKNYYFSHGQYQAKPSDYLDMLSALGTLRRAYREWSRTNNRRLGDFITFIDMVVSAGVRITNHAAIKESDSAVNVITAHAAKGQEFDAVFILHANKEHWDKPFRGSASLSWPINLPIGISGDNDDDRARLFYVSLTRAKSKLFITNHTTLENGKQSTVLRFLTKREDRGLPIQLIPSEERADGNEELATRLGAEWHIRHLPSKPEHKALLAHKMEYYRLSPTDVNAYLDVTSGGPRTFLLRNLLKFPQAKSSSAAFGTAIHSALAIAHTTAKKTVEDVEASFRQALEREPLSEQQMRLQVEHGMHILTPYVKVRNEAFFENSRVEQSFIAEGSTLKTARLTGRLDKLVLKNGDWQAGGELVVIDWKTGKPHQRWSSTVGLYKNRQQLLFYKLLIENSRTYAKKYVVSSGALEFIEAPSHNQPPLLAMDYSDSKIQAELERFGQLVEAVWQKIMNLDFPDTSHYPANITGMREFENSLLEGPDTAD